MKKINNTSVKLLHIMGIYYKIVYYIGLKPYIGREKISLCYEMNEDRTVWESEIMVDTTTLIELIENDHECEYLDFKAEQYKKHAKEDLIKDIMAMANSQHNGNKYIIVGIKDIPGEQRQVIGIPPLEFVDDSEYQQLIKNNIEPDINFRYYPFKYEEKVIGVFELTDCSNKPYMLRKQLNKLPVGFCLVRKGSHQCIATRSDYDWFYLQKEKFEVLILEPYMSSIEKEYGSADLRVTIRNLSTNPVTIVYGIVNVFNKEGVKLISHRVYGLDKHVGADFTLYMPPKSEVTGYLCLGFESSDCIVLDLDEYGTTDERFVLELILVDTLDNEYVAKIANAMVYARGRVLWKVQKKRDKR